MAYLYIYDTCCTVFKPSCVLLDHVVNRGDWLESPANIKVTKKDAKIYVGRSMTLHNKEFKITTTAPATGTSLNKRFNEQNNGCARALLSTYNDWPPGKQ